MALKLAEYNNRGFERGASRLRECAWWIVRAIIFQSRCPLPTRLKTFCLRLFGAKVGTGVVIRSKVNITFPWKLTIGHDTWIGDEVLVLSLAHVIIGSNCCISQRAFLCTGSHDFSKPSFDLITKPIVIEDGCWIAANSVVLPGVTFRAGSMCAAGSVVVKDVESGDIVGGNPARTIAKRLAVCD